jgi:crotonobetainyl-CoA:carnitine CoA-transferase CaiB-like acyl-CoA transferase
VPHPNVPGPQPLTGDDSRAQVPRVGAHSRAILAELGYTQEEIRNLLAQAVVFEP